MTQQLVPKYVHVLPETSKRSKYNLLVQTIIYADNLGFHSLGFLGFLLNFPEGHSVYNVTELNTFPNVFWGPKNGSALVRALS